MSGIVNKLNLPLGNQILFLALLALADFISLTQNQNGLSF